MEQEKGIVLLKRNLGKVEAKFDDFFKAGVPRWPGEKQDFLRNHHKNLENLSMKNLTFDRLGLSNLPDPIMKELEQAFEAFRNGQEYS